MCACSFCIFPLIVHECFLCRDVSAFLGFISSDDSLLSDMWGFSFAAAGSTIGFHAAIVSAPCFLAAAALAAISASREIFLSW